MNKKQLREEIQLDFIDLWCNFGDKNPNVDEVRTGVAYLYETIANYQDDPRSETMKNKIWDTIQPK
tara:strand:+ start:418 stop:615 length:198 start_codon:yes stop_codon:yes gene_type:complete